MHSRMPALVIAALVIVAPAARGQLVAEQITTANTSRIFGGGDAEGGIGDWYLSNGVVEAIIDDAGLAPDLVGVVPAGSEPVINSSSAPTGGTLIDAALVGRNNDQLSQMFAVAGLSTENFLLFDSVIAPAPGVIRATGKLLLPPVSARPDPCIDVVTEYRVEGTNDYLTIVTTATNGCAAEGSTLGGFLDAFVWTIRSNIPFSSGVGGSGFDHPILDFTNLASALETPTFMAAPGVITEADGVIDPANGTVSGEVSYGLLPVRASVDQDGPGGADPVVTPVNGFFGVSSSLVSALGSLPVTGALQPGGVLSYERRLYVGDRNDVASTANQMITELAGRTAFATGTISGDVDAADASDVRASIVVRRLGRCSIGAESCKSGTDCSAGPCVDPIPTIGFGPGGAVSHVRTGPTGAFSNVVLPRGDYELVVSAAERDDVVVSPMTVGAGDTIVDVPALSARGTLAFLVREKRKKKPQIAAKLVVKGTGGTPDPRFAKTFSATLGGEDLVPESFGGTQHGPTGDARGQGNVVYTSTGEGSIELRPGTYEVWASRGLEYGVKREEVTITAGQITEASFLLKRVLKTKNALSADFHVHSVRSFDTSPPIEDRVISFAAEGVDVIVSTEHDKHVDYEPVIGALGLSPTLRAIPGVEVTGAVPNPPIFPNSIGHINAWPMPVRPDERRDGSIQDEYVAPNWVFSRLRAVGGPDTVIQYNHPRAGVAGLTSIGFFNGIGCQRCANAIDVTCTQDDDCPAGEGRECTCVGYQPDRPIDMPPNDLLRDKGILGPASVENPDGHDNLAFDVFEIANGARGGDIGSLVEMRRDWFSLLDQDLRRWGTGVSDSHRVTVEHAGWPRTFVFGAGDDPRAVDVTTLNARVKAGAMMFTSGPFIEMIVKAGKQKGRVGEEITSKNGKVKVKIRVTSPAWIPVDEVRLLVNGQVHETFDATSKPKVKPIPSNVESSGKTMRFKATRKVTLAQDGYLIVEAGIRLPAAGEPAPASPEVMNAILPGAVPFAFTNPVFVDVGGDGYQAPGLATTAATRTGRMTGVTRAERDAAIATGEHLPIWKLRLPLPPR